jgi:hypothetical protein
MNLNTKAPLILCTAAAIALPLGAALTFAAATALYASAPKSPRPRGNRNFSPFRRSGLVLKAQ